MSLDQGWNCGFRMFGLSEACMALVVDSNTNFSICCHFCASRIVIDGLADLWG